MQAAAYDFPVALQSVYTISGQEVPKVKAVVRGDTKVPIAAVSTKYNLVTHSEVLKQAESFITKFGEPERRYDVGRNGAVLAASFTYKDKKLLVNPALGDSVGLRVYIENSYNASTSVRISIGGLVLSCLNGMVSAKNVFDFRYQHRGSHRIELPHPDEVVAAFHNEGQKWAYLTEIPVPAPQFDTLIDSATERGILAVRNQHYFSDNRPNMNTAWDFMQGLTYVTTHNTPNLSPVGKIDRLRKISSFVEKSFLTEPQTVN